MKKFLELELYVQDSTIFGNNSTIDICEQGAMLFECFTCNILTRSEYAIFHGFITTTSVWSKLTSSTPFDNGSTGEMLLETETWVGVVDGIGDDEVDEYTPNQSLSWRQWL